jgi:hypothetical protein
MRSAMERSGVGSLSIKSVEFLVLSFELSPAHPLQPRRPHHKTTMGGWELKTHNSTLKTKEDLAVGGPAKLGFGRWKRRSRHCW